MKKTIALLIALLLPAIVHGATLSISPSSQSVTTGDTFSVAINLNTQNASVDGVDLRYLNYNPSLLQVVSVTPGSLMPLTLANSANSSLGRITFSQVINPGGSKYSSSGTLATVIFKALAAGTANVTFNYTSGNTTDSNVAVAGSDVLTSVTNGSYTINGTTVVPPTPSSTGGGSGGGGGGSSSSGVITYYTSNPATVPNLSSVSGAGNATTDTSVGSAPYTFTTNLSYGSRGIGVIELQKFLVAQGYITADNVTGYFGLTTEAALQKFQAAQGLVSLGSPATTGYGNFGPSTRAKINSLRSGGYAGANGTAVNASVSGTGVVVSGPLTRALGRGSSGNDVTTLQNFLISQGYLATGNATGFFGPLTQTAVQSFQRAQGIVSSGDPVSTGYGNVGPSTRARINASLSASGGATTPASTSTSDLQSQLNAMQAQAKELLKKLEQAQ